MDNHRPTWAEIDLAAIRSNVLKIKALLSPQTQLMAVVKANAYGHGMVQVARTCLDAGASFLAVATLDEGIALRKEGIDSPVLILGYTPEEHAGTAIAYHIDTTVFRWEMAEALSEAAVRMGETAFLHIKIDTGMGRIGFSLDAASVAAIKKISELPGIEIRGIFSHFATADHQDKTFANDQLASFGQFIGGLEREGIHIPIKHLANSAAIMEMPSAHFNMVRSGIITYGLYPSNEVNREVLQLEPAMRFLSRISFLKTIPRGSAVSYGRTFVAEKETVVATVPVGYADGYSRLLSNRGWAAVKGRQVPLIGRVCMDQCMFDVTAVQGVKEGDEIVLFGKPADGVTADDLANLIGTINYEVVCAPSSRVPRKYIE